MKESLLYYVAVPCTENVLNLITFLSIKLPKNVGVDKEGYGLFIYSSGLELEAIDVDREWILEDSDAEQVLAFYASKDFDGICAYLNALPERPFNVCIDSNYLSY